jgi:hypothetical protein
MFYWDRARQTTTSPTVTEASASVSPTAVVKDTSLEMEAKSLSARNSRIGKTLGNKGWAKDWHVQNLTSCAGYDVCPFLDCVLLF